MSDLTIRWPDANAEQVEAARGRLEVAGRRLRSRSVEEVVSALGSLFDVWCDPGSSWRRRLAAELPPAAGLSPATVRAGLEIGLEHWTGEALMAALHAELRALRTDASVRLVPHGLTSVVLAGCIPMPGLLQAVLPLALRSPSLVKCASRDPVTPVLLAASLAEIDRDLARCLEVVSFPGDDALASARLLDSDCVVVSGSDETVAAIRSRLPAGRRLVAYGHKLSLAVVSTDSVRADREGTLADALALDVALWDQLGCLSPVAVYVMGAGAPEAAGQLAGALAGALERREGEMPRGEVDAGVAATIRTERDEAAVRAAAGRAVEVHGSEGTAWTVIAEDGPELRAAPLHRFVRVHPVAEADALVAALRPLRPHLSAVALAGFAPESPTAGALLELGASRLCAPGRLQAPPVDWPHDGRPLLSPMARLAAVELPGEDR